MPSRWCVTKPYLVVSLLVLTATPAPAAHGATAEAKSAATGLRLYTSRGHALGFGTGSYWVSNGAYSLKVELVGAAPVAAIDEESGGGMTLGRVSYRGLWEGIRVTFDAPATGIVRSTWTVEPGGDPRNIRVRYKRPIRIGADGTLTISASATGALAESAPVAWQEVEGERRTVAVAFTLVDDDEVGFAVGTYDRTRSLVIDPTLSWNTFLGGVGGDVGQSIAVDGSGGIYVTGWSSESWGNPVRAFTPPNGLADAFVAKLDAGGALIWNTFLGGSGNDFGLGLALDGSGNVYVAGRSETTWGSPMRGYAASTDGFAAMLDASGALLWNTFLGSSSLDEAAGIAVDAGGNAYVAGVSFTTWGSPVRAHAGSSEGFAAKLDAGGALSWNTFLGSPGQETARGIAVGGSGNVYVTGWGNATWGTPIRPYTADYDGFAARLDPSGVLSWNTFLGGSGGEQGTAIVVDENENVYVAGWGNTTWGAPVRPFSAGPDGFAAKLDSSGALAWNTFLGGSGTDFTDGPRGIAVDGGGAVYVVGLSNAAWGSPTRPYTADWDAFAAKLERSGALAWSAFLGGAALDAGYGIAVDGGSAVFVSGTSGATWGSPVRPFTPAAFDAFVAKLEPSSVAEVPAFSSRGLIALVLLLASAALLTLRRGAVAHRG